MPSPLVQRLTDELGYAGVDEDNFDAFIESTPLCVLFFTDQPKQFPESNDVAVILPELIKAFPALTPAVVSTSHERTLRGRYNFRAWPALVFLKEGKYLGDITKVRNWDEYTALIPDILARKPQPDPGIGTPVVFNPGPAGCGQ